MSNRREVADGRLGVTGLLGGLSHHVSAACRTTSILTTRSGVWTPPHHHALAAVLAAAVTG